VSGRAQVQRPIPPIQRRPSRAIPPENSMVSPISAASHKDFCGESCDKSSLSITINILFTIIRNPSRTTNREIAKLDFILSRLS
jgi:hypothetical protein